MNMLMGHTLCDDLEPGIVEPDYICTAATLLLIFIFQLMKWNDSGQQQCGYR